ncbi:MAG: thioredoxin domain-containing protein [Holosporales bacterium]|jgi:protein-disulfide isomerase|nr:thioredoxin domain-containing protein [Holosporales bacterium]
MEKKCSLGHKVCAFLSILALGVSLAAYLGQKESAVKPVDSTFDEKVKNVVIDVMRQNPQLLMDAMGEGIAKKREDAIKQLSKDVAEQKTEISEQSMKFGESGSKNVMLCFFDPLCKHCIDFQKSMIKIVRAKKDVNFRLIPVAVLGDDSITLAKVYLAVYDKSAEKAIAFIEKITATDGEMDKAAIEKALKDVGLDPKKIQETMPDVDKKLAANGAIAEKLKIPVVPAVFFIRGSESTMIQATGVDQLLAVIDGKKLENEEAE